MSKKKKVDISNVPKDTGVYLLKDSNDAILYVGKALDLRTRVQSYFREKGDGRLKIRVMRDKISTVDYILAPSENKALILEDKLIKEYQPRYNSMLKDGKSYPSIKVTVHEKFPRLDKVHYCEKDGAVYFGPFAKGVSVKRVVKQLQDKYKLRRCKGPNFAPDAPCLYAQIEMCDQPCMGKISQQEYKSRIEKVIKYLKIIEEMEMEIDK